MVDNMLEHLDATQGALPLLQFAATQLWEARDPARKLLTASAYQSEKALRRAQERARRRELEFGSSHMQELKVREQP